MKRILYLFFALFTTTSIMQSQTPIAVDTVIPLQGISQEEAYVRAYTWIAKNYNSANDAIQLADKEAGKIVSKGMFLHEHGSRMLYLQFYGKIYYTLTLQFREGRYKITVDGFTHESQQEEGDFFHNSFGTVTDGFENGGKAWAKKKSFQKYWTNLQESCIEYGTTLISEINNAINQATDDDW